MIPYHIHDSRYSRTAFQNFSNVVLHITHWKICNHNHISPSDIAITNRLEPQCNLYIFPSFDSYNFIFKSPREVVVKGWMFSNLRGGIKEDNDYKAGIFPSTWLIDAEWFAIPISYCIFTNWFLTGMWYDFLYRKKAHRRTAGKRECSKCFMRWLHYIWKIILGRLLSISCKMFWWMINERQANLLIELM